MILELVGGFRPLQGFRAVVRRTPLGGLQAKGCQFREEATLMNGAVSGWNPGCKVKICFWGSRLRAYIYIQYIYIYIYYIIYI